MPGFSIFISSTDITGYRDSILRCGKLPVVMSCNCSFIFQDTLCQKTPVTFPALISRSQFLQGSPMRLQVIWLLLEWNQDIICLLRFPWWLFRSWAGSRTKDNYGYLHVRCDKHDMESTNCLRLVSIDYLKNYIISSSSFPFAASIELHWQVPLDSLTCTDVIV